MIQHILSGMLSGTATEHFCAFPKVVGRSDVPASTVDNDEEETGLCARPKGSGADANRCSRVHEPQPSGRVSSPTFDSALGVP